METICSYKIPESAVKRISGIFAVYKNCGYHAHILWKIPLKYALIEVYSSKGDERNGEICKSWKQCIQGSISSEIYIDKTNLLDFTNSVLGTKQAYICNSRPRRFGKSITADMLTAYYSKGCDSRELFMNYNIAQTEDFEKYLNKYDVIHLDMQWILMDAGAPERISGYINKNVISELADLYKDIDLRNQKTLYGALSVINSMTNNKFVIIIDEWDVLIRDEAANSSVQEEYINFLRGMFKGSEPTKYIELAFLTGILPIKKLKTQSALNNFEEFTMISPGGFAHYIGFTEDEVKKTVHHI